MPARVISPGADVSGSKLPARHRGLLIRSPTPIPVVRSKPKNSVPSLTARSLGRCAPLRSLLFRARISVRAYHGRWHPHLKSKPNARCIATKTGRWPMRKPAPAILPAVSCAPKTKTALDLLPEGVRLVMSIRTSAVRNSKKGSASVRRPPGNHSHAPHHRHHPTNTPATSAMAAIKIIVPNEHQLWCWRLRYVRRHNLPVRERNHVLVKNTVKSRCAPLPGSLSGPTRPEWHR